MENCQDAPCPQTCDHAYVTSSNGMYHQTVAYNARLPYRATERPIGSRYSWRVTAVDANSIAQLSDPHHDIASATAQPRAELR